jgi:hypothetical protein
MWMRLNLESSLEVFHLRSPREKLPVRYGWFKCWRYAQTKQWLTYGSGHVHGLVLNGEELIGFERDKLHRETARI